MAKSERKSMRGLKPQKGFCLRVIISYKQRNRKRKRNYDKDTRWEEGMDSCRQRSNMKLFCVFLYFACDMQKWIGPRLIGFQLVRRFRISTWLLLTTPTCSGPHHRPLSP